MATTEVGVSLKDGYNGNISARGAGRIGGNMVIPYSFYYITIFVTIFCYTP